MNIILFDDDSRLRLLPFTWTRPTADIRCGILSGRERWELMLGVASSSSLTEAYLQPVYPLQADADNLLVCGSLIATPALAKAIQGLQRGTALVQAGQVLAARLTSVPAYDALGAVLAGLQTIPFEEAVVHISHIWDIFSLNDQVLRADFELLTAGRTSAPLPAHVTAIGAENIFLEAGATLQPCIINATTGPVYIGAGAEVMEGCMLRGPIALCEHAALKMGAKVYGATTLGPGSKAGGELNNVVFFDNSNKGHDGFLGNAVIGSWCNLGADTNCSNLKNNYGGVSVWEEHSPSYVPSGLQFCGLMMADHSKCGINTMFNTGTVAGVSCNIFGGGFPDKHIPSFSWGGSEGLSTYRFDQAMDTARRMMARRGRSLSDAELGMYRHIFETTTAGQAV